jgi:hypothetical protein
MTGGPIEPSADLREMAKGLFEQYVALIEAGFTSHQALAIIGHIMAVGGAE